MFQAQIRSATGRGGREAEETEGDWQGDEQIEDRGKRRMEKLLKENRREGRGRMTEKGEGGWEQNLIKKNKEMEDEQQVMTKVQSKANLVVLDKPPYLRSQKLLTNFLGNTG